LAFSLSAEGREVVEVAKYCRRRRRAEEVGKKVRTALA